MLKRRIGRGNRLAECHTGSARGQQLERCGSRDRPQPARTRPRKRSSVGAASIAPPTGAFRFGSRQRPPAPLEPHLQGAPSASLRVSEASGPRRRGPGVRGLCRGAERRGHRSAEPMLAALTLLLLRGLVPRGCGRSREPQLFELLPPSRTGVTFATVARRYGVQPSSPTCTTTTWGVAVGDVNNDGLPDHSECRAQPAVPEQGGLSVRGRHRARGVADSEGWKTGGPWPTSTAMA